MVYTSSLTHPSKGKPSSELFCRRQFRDKSPFLTDLESNYDFEISDRDREIKEKKKLDESRKRKAV